MGFAVFHVEKVTTGAGSLGAHIDRSPGQQYTYKNADPERLDQNIHFTCRDFNTMKLNEAIDFRIKEGYTGKKALRKDAVKGMSMVLTGSHEEMKKIFSQADSKKAWLEANIKFVQNEFGSDNVVRFTLHLDEKTPHLHVVVVPLTADGRLSAKEIMGDKLAMSARQSRYGLEMEPFGLQRGIIGSKAIHNSEGWYLGQQKIAQESILKRLPEFSILNRINPSRFLDNVSDQLKIASKQMVDAQLDARRSQSQVSTVQADLQNLQQNYSKINSELKETKLDLSIMKHKANGYKLKPEFEDKFSKIQIDFLQEKKQAAEKEQNKINFNKGFGQNKSRGMER